MYRFVTIGLHSVTDRQRQTTLWTCDADPNVRSTIG